MAKKLTIDEFISRANNIHNNLYDYSNVVYKNYITPVDIICIQHGIFKQLPKNHIRDKNGCPKCSGNLRLDTKTFIKLSIDIHGQLYDYSKVKYVNNIIDVEIICKNHGSFLQRPANHIYKKSMCPSCRTSKGENEIQSFLIENNIDYKKEYKFKNCVNLKVLRFDFYLPDYNLCVEFDGIQHFKSIPHFGGDKAFKQVVINDTIKNAYCKSNNINLLRISYKDNIQKKIKEIYGF